MAIKLTMTSDCTGAVISASGETAVLLSNTEIEEVVIMLREEIDRIAIQARKAIVPSQKFAAGNADG